MDTLNRAQTDQLIQKLTEMRESVLKKNDASSTEEIFLNESITNVETYLNILSDRDVIEYDKETLGIIQRLKQNLRFLSENRNAKSDFDFKMMVSRLTETLNTILQKRKKSEDTDPDTDREALDSENSSDILRSTDTAQTLMQQMGKERRPDIIESTDIAKQKIDEICREIPGAFYDIGCGIQLYSTSDVSNIIQAIRWTSDDFQRSYKPDAALQNYKFETDFFHIEPKDPRDNGNFPKNSSGMITVRVKLPNDINYQFLQLKAYIKFGPKWNFVDATLKEKSVTFKAVKLDALCIVSKPLKERVNILPNGCKYVAQTDNRVEVIFPPGAVESEESVTLHVIPVNKEILRRQYEERSKNGEAILAISDCLYTTGDTNLRKKVQVKLPLNDIRNPTESDEDYVYRLFRQNTHGQFTLTDNVVTVDENHTAVFETDQISGTSVSLIGKDELKKGPLEISGNIEEMHGHQSICKVLFFVSEVTSRGLTVLLACIEKSKMQAFCLNCEERGFQLFKNWISKDLVFKPQIKIAISLKGCFSMPRFSSRKRLDMTFLPNSTENFTRFVVEIKPKMDQDVYGILLLTKDQEFLDEIIYNTLTNKEYANASLSRKNTDRQRTQRSDQRTATKGKSFIDRQPTLPVRQFSEDDFLTEKGVMAIAKLLNADKMFETVLHLDMKQVQYDQICEKFPSSNRQAFTLLKTALDPLKKNKVDKLTSALESAEEGGLAESIRQIFEEQGDLSKLQK
ncbi:uncharacterized protein LOC127717739 isoform X14 [Mytilus californianus]|uniref:uncharacterized protein LOC127717739 isoform X14 n=1 Tax=Mytilus californianus TaxID=6549 RepID=UPI0022451209|nr:uncharacterized protein LOC127717739 isoform X14 [Mytilus californianus]